MPIINWHTVFALLKILGETFTKISPSLISNFLFRSIYTVLCKFSRFHDIVIPHANKGNHLSFICFSCKCLTLFKLKNSDLMGKGGFYWIFIRTSLAFRSTMVTSSYVVHRWVSRSSGFTVAYLVIFTLMVLMLLLSAVLRIQFLRAVLALWQLLHSFCFYWKILMASRALYGSVVSAVAIGSTVSTATLVLAVIRARCVWEVPVFMEIMNDVHPFAVVNSTGVMVSATWPVLVVYGMMDYAFVSMAS